MMPDNKRFYWIKLKTTFFDEEAIDFLMSQENGSKYIVLYQMLCLQTANNNGELSTKIGEMIMPYDVKKIVRDTKYFDFDTVTIALELFKRLGLVYEEENQVLHISNFSEMVGSETSSAKRVRDYRERQKAFQCNSDVTPDSLQCNSNVTIEPLQSNIDVTQEYRDKSIEYRDKSIEKDIDYCAQSAPTKKPHKKKYGAYNHVRLTDEEFNRLVEEYGEAITAEYIKKVDEYCELKGAVYKNHNLAIRNFLKRDNVKKNPQPTPPFGSGLKNQPPKPQEPELQPDFVPDPDDPFNDYWEV